MASTQPVWVSPQAYERLQNPTGLVALNTPVVPAMRPPGVL
jgi:hypothetical protein